jgi:transcription antitermination factor NusA-like protein
MDTDHWTTVARLSELLDDIELQEADVIVPNQVRNLAIVRGGRQIGVIELLNGHANTVLYQKE